MMFGYVLIAALTVVLIIVMIKRALGHYEPLNVTRRKAMAALHEELRQGNTRIRYVPVAVPVRPDPYDGIEAAPTYDDVRNPGARIAFHDAKSMWDS